VDSSGTNVGWYLTDRLGSVRQVVNGSNGTVLDQLVYTSYGGIFSESNPANGDRFKFAGGEYDANTEDYRFNARYYGPTVGRFLSEDPKGFTAGDANLYRYSANSPVNITDPSGESWWDYFVSGVQTVGGVIMVGTGIAISGTGLGAVFGTGMVIYGSDLTVTGIVGLTTGQVRPTLTATAVETLTGSHTAGVVTDIAVPIVLQGGAWWCAWRTPAAFGQLSAGKAPMQVPPGVRVLEGGYIDDLGRVQPWRAYYDKFGRICARTDYNAGNPAAGIPDVHHHIYQWGPGMNPLETGSHIPGPFVPANLPPTNPLYYYLNHPPVDIDPITPEMLF
jgi:RHS repeat-associated protein